MLRVDPAGARPIAPPDARSRRAERKVIAKGLPASPGAACGKAVFDADTAENWAARRREGDPGPRSRPAPRTFTACTPRKGILTARGGMTSHAAVVARGMGRPCVSRRRRARDRLSRRRLMRVGGHEVDGRRRSITIDGATGEVMLGEVPTVQPELAGDFGTLMAWADAKRRLGVRANAETPLDCRTAREFGAEGIGLCRTEHMFFDAERITNVRQMILAEDEAGRRARARQAAPRPARRLRRDLPDHGRACRSPSACSIRRCTNSCRTARRSSPRSPRRPASASTRCSRRAAELHEFNPMLGHRGCRLGITYPEIYEMQARAIFEAAVAVARGAARRRSPR